MIVEATLYSGWIEVHAWVDVDADEINIVDVHYDDQQVRTDKLPSELVEAIEEIAEDEWAMGWDES